MGHRGLSEVIQIRKIYIQNPDFLAFALNNCPVPTIEILMGEKSKTFGVGDVGMELVPVNFECGEEGSMEGRHWVSTGQNMRKDGMGLVVLGCEHQGPGGPFFFF